MNHQKNSEIQFQDLLLSHYKQQNDKKQELSRPSFFQVQYLDSKILKVSEDTILKYEKSTQEENMVDYFEESEKDQAKLFHYKDQLKRKLFKIRSKEKHNRVNYSHNENFEMIKSFSVADSGRTKISNNQSLIRTRSQFSSKEKKMPDFNEEVVNLLDYSLKATQKKNRFRLRGGTQIQKEKKNQEIMKNQQKGIINILNKGQFKVHRAKNISQISNKEMYNINFLNYQKTKTKAGIEKYNYQKKVRKIQRPIEKFQEFILRQTKISSEEKIKLEKFYMKMRQEFRRVEKNREVYNKFKKVDIQ